MNVKVLVGNFSFGLGATFLSTLQAIVATPLLIKSDGAHVYGAWIMLADFFVAMQIFDFGVTAYAAQRIAKHHNVGDMEGVRGSFLASLVLVIVMAIAMALIGYFAGGLLVDDSRLTKEELIAVRECALFGLIAVAIQLVGYAFIAPSRALEQMKIVNYTSLFSAMVSFIAVAYLAYAGYGIYAMAIGLIVRSVVNLIGGILSVRRLGLIHRVFELRKETFYRALTDQVSRVPVNFLSNFSSIGLTSGDGLLIGYFVGFEQVAFYSVSKKIFDLVKTVLDIFSYSAFGGAASTLSKMTGAARVAFLINYVQVLAWLSIFLVLGAYAISREFVTLWVNESAYIGGSLAAGLAASVLLICVSSGLFTLSRAAGSFGDAAATSTLELFVKLAVSIALVKWLGVGAIVLGGAIAALIASTRYLYLLEIGYKKLSGGTVRLVMYGLIAVVFSISANTLFDHKLFYIAAKVIAIVALVLLGVAIHKELLPRIKSV